MLAQTIQLKSIHLVDAGLDCDTLLEIAKGLKQSMSLEFLDLRHNIFDSRGLAGTISALRESMSIKHLYLEDMKISLSDAKLLAEFFEQSDCMLEELELNEADINIESLDVIMEALYKADHLRRLSLSKNFLDEKIC
jgi:Ran GTPase-activating protein (RanGAP) involved in mRNA processing and transport